MATGMGKIRSERRARQKAEYQANMERNEKVRQLLFGKGNGKMKNLDPADLKFVKMVCHDRYEIYLRTAANPISFQAYRRRWYGSQKKRWIHHDVPLMTRKNFEESKSGTPILP